MLHVPVIHYFLLSNNIPLYRYTPFSLSIHQLMDIGIPFDLQWINKFLFMVKYYKIVKSYNIDSSKSNIGM